MIEVGKLTEKNLKTTVYIFIVLIILALIGVFIVPNVMTLKKRHEDYQMKVKELENEKNNYEIAKKKYEDTKALKEKYEKEFEALKEKFKEGIVEDETHLKILIQRLINYLGLEMLKTGKIEQGEVGEGYSKKFIPYTIRGDFDQVSRFFFYLENSKWLITFKGSELSMKSVKYKEQDKVEVMFKTGAYYSEGGELFGDIIE